MSRGTQSGHGQFEQKERRRKGQISDSEVSVWSPSEWAAVVH